MHQVLICDIYITAANLLIRNLELGLGRKEKTVLNTVHKLEHSPCFSGALQYLKKLSDTCICFHISFCD